MASTTSQGPGESQTPLNTSNNEESRSALPTSFPFILVPGLSNFRDIGGWPISPPTLPTPSAPPCKAHVRHGIIYRGSDTNRITPEGERILYEALSVRTDFDLRSKQQIEKTGGFKEIKGITRVWAPVFKDEEYSEERARERYELYAGEGTEGIITAFLEILHAGAPMFRTVLLHILDTVPPDSLDANSSSPPNPADPADLASEPNPPQQSPTHEALNPQPPAIFLHCTTGNNRTGIFISLLLLFLGVPVPVICAEYALSSLGLAPTRHLNVARLLKKGAFEGLPEEERRRKCERMLDAREESMQDMLVEVQRRWGERAEGWFREEVGLEEWKMREVRERLVVVEGDVEWSKGGERV